MSINKVILVGHVGKDPEVRYFDNNRSVANFSLATTERGYVSANGTQIPDRTEWHRIVCYQNNAKVAEQYIKKGAQLYIEGKIRNRDYTDKDGIQRYITEIVCDTLQMLGRKQQGEGTGNEVESYTAAATVSNNTAQQSAVQEPAPFEAEEQIDDLPF